MVTASTLLKPALRLSADEFPAIAAREFGIRDEMERVWPGFAPVAHTLVDNFWATIDHPRSGSIVSRLATVDGDVRGVAYEGTGMGLAMIDCVWPVRARLAEFIAGPGQAYRPLLYIGAGLALPRLPVNPLRVVARHTDDDRWLILDGCGFYHGFFSPKKSLQQMVRPRYASGYAGRVFDRGLGRSLWFTAAANPDRIAHTVGRFPKTRRGDLWSGVGFACAYAAAVVDQSAIDRLVRAAESDSDSFAVGVATAAEMRHAAGHPATYTDLACRSSWGGMDGAAVSRIAGGQRAADVPGDPVNLPYEAWRERIRSAWHASASENSLTSKE